MCVTRYLTAVCVAVAICGSAVAQEAPAPVTAPQPITPIAAPVVPALIPPPLPANMPSKLPTDQPLTLAQAISTALANHPDITVAMAALASATETVRQAEIGFRPSASASVQATESGPSDDSVSGRTSTSYTAGISGQQLLYDFGRTSKQVAQALQAEEAARQSLAQTKQDVINQVKQAYYGLLQSQQLVGVQQSNLDAQQAHLAMTQTRLDAGDVARADVVRAQTAVADAIYSVTTAQNTAAVARVALNLALGVDARTPVTVVESQEPPVEVPGAGGDMVGFALGGRPQVLQARANLYAAQEAARLARKGNLPEFSANASYGWSGVNFPPDSDSWSYGASVQWSFFDSGLTRSRVRSAEAGVASAAASLRQTEQSISSAVVQAHLNVETARQKITASESEVASADESLRLATGRYQAGVATYIEVIDAEAALVSAQTNRVNALYGLSTARDNLRYALGLEESAQ